MPPAPRPQPSGLLPPRPRGDLSALPGARLLPATIHTALSSFDDTLVAVLAKGHIRLVRAAWLLTLPGDYRIVRRQELEALEEKGTSPSPLLSPEEAVGLVRKGNRGVGALTYGCMSCCVSTSGTFNAPPLAALCGSLTSHSFDALRGKGSV